MISIIIILFQRGSIWISICLIRYVYCQIMQNCISTVKLYNMVYPPRISLDKDNCLKLLVDSSNVKIILTKQFMVTILYWPSKVLLLLIKIDISIRLLAKSPPKRSYTSNIICTSLLFYISHSLLEYSNLWYYLDGA
jgi:hypothetical protein